LNADDFFAADGRGSTLIISQNEKFSF